MLLLMVVVGFIVRKREKEGERKRQHQQQQQYQQQQQRIHIAQQTRGGKEKSFLNSCL
jgi:hypothetical protein